MAGDRKRAIDIQTEPKRNNNTAVWSGERFIMLESGDWESEGKSGIWGRLAVDSQD